MRCDTRRKDVRYLLTLSLKRPAFQAEGIGAAYASRREACLALDASVLVLCDAAIARKASLAQG